MKINCTPACQQIAHQDPITAMKADLVKLRGAGIGLAKKARKRDSRLKKAVSKIIKECNTNYNGVAANIDLIPLASESC